MTTYPRILDCLYSYCDAPKPACDDCDFAIEQARTGITWEDWRRQRDAEKRAGTDGQTAPD